ncbi:MAG TPA: CAP domain-containing protein, partial [Nitrososphaerales archaeon]|nr:CAP domain-containing protein [Nitrososphaerales archaeon]
MGRVPLWGVGAMVVLVALGLATVVYLPTHGNQPSETASSSSSPNKSVVAGINGTSVIMNTEHQGSSPSDWLLDSPAIVRDSLTVDYPPGYQAIDNFTLGLINSDRAAAGLAPVALSTVASGQQHADSMAYFGYFSHWDNQGFKPYMRYTILGGTGSVTENLAVDVCNQPSSNTSQSVPASCNLQTIENAIKAAEWGMMNNDTKCCNNGHRQNILGPIHNRVSVGVAYNATTLYLVEDFEDNYIGSESLQLSAGNVTFQGSLAREPWALMNRTAGAEITVFFDPTPTNINASDLVSSPSCMANSELNETAACKYEGAYNPGTEIWTILPTCPGQFCGAGNFTYAKTWQYSAGKFQIAF